MRSRLVAPSKRITLDESSATSEYDAGIVARIARGDREAESHLWFRFRGVTLCMLQKRTRWHDEVAEDLWHETFIRALEKLRRGELREPHKLAGYVYGIADRIYIGWTRREIRRRTDIDSEIDRFRSLEPSPPQVIQEEQIRRALRAVIREMRVTRDRIVLACHLRGLTKEEICGCLDLSRTHHDRVISRARKRLAELLMAEGVRREDLSPWLDLWDGSE